MTRNFHLPGRSAAYGTSAMIATSHPEASFVGLEVMRRGGSAVDAAIAAAALLAVIEPAMTGIGGDCFAIVARPGAKPVALNGSGRAPAGATLDSAKASGVKTIEDDSPFAITVPGAVDAWCRLHDDYGKIALSELLEPAAKRAEEGYPTADRVIFDWRRSRDRLARHPDTAAIFLPGGEAPAIGDIHRQPALAGTLRTIGKKGRAGFYEGAAADDMVAALQRHGGSHTLDDFAAQSSDYADPISSRFAGHDILECPPNGQGATALLILKALEGWNAYEGAADEGERAHLLALATRAAYFLRDRGITDPAALPVGVDEFLSDASVDFVRSWTKLAEDDRSKLVAPWETDTICLSAVDRDGLAVSFINSLFFLFGSTIVAPKSGVLFHCRGTSFQLDPTHPNRLGPRKRPMHTIIPGMVMQGDRVVMPFGVMGGHYQAAGHAHFLLRRLKEGLDLQSAADAPRLFAYGPAVEVEDGLAPDVVQHLRSRGHAVQRSDLPIGGCQAIWIDHDRGVLIGASDHRKDGCALGL